MRGDNCCYGGGKGFESLGSFEVGVNSMFEVMGVMIGFFCCAMNGGRW